MDLGTFLMLLGLVIFFVGLTIFLYNQKLAVFGRDPIIIEYAVKNEEIYEIR